jgi:hypothetical protein
MQKTTPKRIAKKNPQKRTLQKAPSELEYFASIYSTDNKKIDPRLGKACLELEQILNKKVLLLIQNPSREYAENAYAEIGPELVTALRRELRTLATCKGIIVVLDSPGGYAKEAYQISTLLENMCGGYEVVVPRYAKSAATLFALGGRRIYMGTHAELGPLDAQVRNDDREEMESALNEVQALEQIFLFSQRVVDQTMLMLIGRTGKKVETLIPLALRFAENLTKPLFEKIDVVHYSKMSRILKIGEEYATRLLRRRYNKDISQGIARYFVTGYPDHDFLISIDEANDIVDTVSLRKGEANLIESMERLGESQEKINEIFTVLASKTLVAVGFVSTKVKEART